MQRNCSAKPTLKEMKGVMQDYLAKIAKRSQCHIRIENDRTIIHGLEADKIYIPSSTGVRYHSDDSFIRLILGPYGSGKTTICIHEVVRRACAMPAWYHGRRRSRWLFIRNTSGELHSTTLQSWLSWFSELGDIKNHQKPLLTYEHTFNDGKGVVELEIIFIALDRPDDVRKIKSLEVTGAYLNELSELPEAVLTHAKGRLNGRYPNKMFCPNPYWTGILCDTNPPDEDHYIYTLFEKSQLPSYRVFHQPPGLLLSSDGTYKQNPDCDNAANLSSDYYTKLAEGQKEGFINVYCMGRYGLVEGGKRVYPEYNDDRHSVDHIEAIQGLPIHLGWDGGFTPACVVFQMSPQGQFRLLKEYIAEDMNVRGFARSIVIPSLQSDFPYNKVGKSLCDPAMLSGEGIMDELSDVAELNNLGIKTEIASTNDPVTRISAVRYFLGIMVQGNPGFILDRTNCPVTRKGFMSGYHFKRLQINNDERYQDKPNKNKYSHPHDALQYGALEFASNVIMDSKAPVDKVNMYNPVPRIFSPEGAFF